MFNTQYFLLLVLSLSVLLATEAFAPRMNTVSPRVQPLFENFGLSFAEDAQENTLREIFGEVNYKSFAEKVDPNALLIRVNTLY